ncbi:MAG: bifunctional nuclease family protein [Pirellulaceae bacterium]
MPVQMRLSRIIISDINEHQVIYLHEVNGDRQFPIMIGLFEATSIERRVKSVSTPRPLTHDLIVSMVDQMGGELDSVVITGLIEGTYFAMIRVRKDGELIEIDSRSSDAIAIAVTCEPNLPIWVSEQVLEEEIGSI